MKRRHPDRRHHLISIGIMITSNERVELALDSLDVFDLAGTPNLLDNTIKLGINAGALILPETSSRATTSIGRAATLINELRITFNISRVWRSATAPINASLLGTYW
jgi:hypothetical protein